MNHENPAVNDNIRRDATIQNKEKKKDTNYELVLRFFVLPILAVMPTGIILMYIYNVHINPSSPITLEYINMKINHMFVRGVMWCACMLLDMLRFIFIILGPDKPLGRFLFNCIVNFLWITNAFIRAFIWVKELFTELTPTNVFS